MGSFDDKQNRALLHTENMMTIGSSTCPTTVKAKTHRRRTVRVITAAPINFYVGPHTSGHDTGLFPTLPPLKKHIFYQRKKAVLYFSIMLAQLQTLFTSLLPASHCSFNYFTGTCIYKAKIKKINKHACSLFVRPSSRSSSFPPLPCQLNSPHLVWSTRCSTVLPVGARGGT